MSAALDCRVLDGADGARVLACPTVGEYLDPPAAGAVLGPGSSCGRLVQKPVSRSKACPARKTVASSKGRPTS